MPEDSNSTQNPIPEESSIPPSPQKPMADVPIPPIDSEPAEVPSEAPEAPREGFSDESNKIYHPQILPLRKQKTSKKLRKNKPKMNPILSQFLNPSKLLNLQRLKYRYLSR